MDFWEVDFCEELAAAGRFVIRYDLRDTGRSVSYPPGRPAYTSHDLIDDALGLLDALDVRTANMVGISMGGAIAQLLSILQPERVATLTLLSTTAIGSVDDDLPGPSPALVKHFADPLPEPDWEELAAVATTSPRICVRTPGHHRSTTTPCEHTSVQLCCVPTTSNPL
jgi:pimeloyl-ACP methyl ester carboxylesterase